MSNEPEPITLPAKVTAELTERLRQSRLAERMFVAYLQAVFDMNGADPGEWKLSPDAGQLLPAGKE